jgi:uncharacterized membrane protein YdfJ with MMPL/SSD domain
VTRLRTALAGQAGHIRVGGDTAANMDFTNAIYGNFPLMLAVISVITFLLLARSFRSVALALKAVVLNLISLGASFGFPGPVLAAGPWLGRHLRRFGHPVDPRLGASHHVRVPV